MNSDYLHCFVRLRGRQVIRRRVNRIAAVIIIVPVVAVVAIVVAIPPATATPTVAVAVTVTATASPVTIAWAELRVNGTGVEQKKSRCSKEETCPRRG